MNPENFNSIDLTEPGSDPPFNWVFARLRDLWIAKGQNRKQPRRSADLARKFDVPQQRISQWASGTDKTRGMPPWHIITALADELNLELRISGDGVRLVRKKRLRRLSEVIEEIDETE
jgi:transcriptional regulator with XRE-family HTH domain